MRNDFHERRARHIRRCRFLLLMCIGIALGACAAPPTVLPTAPRTAQTTSTPRATFSIVQPTTAPTRAAPPQRASTPPPIAKTATLVPNKTAAPTPTAFATALPVSPKVIVSESSVTFNAYPYEKFLIEKRDPATNIVYKAFDRAAYEAALPNLKIEPKTFRAIVLENEFLKVTLLPELGGRIFQITHKPAGRDLLYNNRVLKPTRWGMPNQDGWLAAGGIEWAFPTQEHGYEWNAAWDARIERDAQSASVILTDTNANDRVRVQVRVTLPAHAAYLAISPRIENPTALPQPVQFWTNALLDLGAHGRISPQTEFYFPDAVFLHSTANDWIPREWVPADNAFTPNAPVSFSNLAGRDLRFYRNWDNYLGVFGANTDASDLAQAFVGAYNYETQVGLARVFSPQLTPGVKLFAWGPNFCCRDLYTDDNSEYFELWGGSAHTFFPDDAVTLQPGETRAWTEYFLPVIETNGIRAALPDFVINLQTEGDRAIVTAYAAAPRQGILILKNDSLEIKRWNFSLGATQRLQETLGVSERPLQLELQDLDGNTLLVTTTS